MALHLVKTENFDKLDDLLAAGYNVDLETSTGYNAMMWACKSGSLKMIKRLLDAGASLNKVKLHADKKSNTPFFAQVTMEHGFSGYCGAAGLLKSCANAQKSTEVLNFLFDNKLDPNFRVYCSLFPFDLSLIVWALWNSYPVYKHDDMSVQQLLLDRKVPIDPYSGASFNMLHITAMMVFNATALTWMLDNKADINKKTWFTGTFYETAVMFGNQVAIDTYNDWILMQGAEDCCKK